MKIAGALRIVCARLERPPSTSARLTPERLRDEVHAAGPGCRPGADPAPHDALRAGRPRPVARPPPAPARRSRSASTRVHPRSRSAAARTRRRAAPDRPFRAPAHALPARVGGDRVGHEARDGAASPAGGRRAGRVRWHIAPSHEVAAGWSEEVELVFIDGDHSEEGCALDWSCWHGFVSLDGHVVFHDARAGLPGGGGCPDRHGRRAPVPRRGDTWLGDSRRSRPHGRGPPRRLNRLVRQRAPQAAAGERAQRAPGLGDPLRSSARRAAPGAPRRVRSRGGCRGRPRAARRGARAGTSGTSARVHTPMPLTATSSAITSSSESSSRRSSSSSPEITCSASERR